MQILTQRGWLTYDQLQVGDQTVGFNPETGRSEWTEIRQVHVYDDAPIVRLSCKTWEATCTPNHRWAAVHWKHTGRKGRQGRTKNEFTREDVMVEAQDITSRHSLRLAAPADMGDGPAISEQEAELLGWVLGDGWVVHPKSRTPGSTHWRALRGTQPSVRLGQAKPEHVKAIDRLVDGLLFTRTTRQTEKPGGGPGLPLVTWEFHRPYSAELLKRSGYDHKNPVQFVLSLSESQREAFLRGVFGAEGSTLPDHPIMEAGDYKGMKTYAQADGAKQDAITLAIYLCGMRPATTSWSRNGAGHNLGCANPRTGATIREAKPFIGGESVKQEDAGRDAVWCVTTDLGTWTMRQDRKVMLTGNSYHWYDKGGLLQPGVTMAVNQTGQPEMILPPGLGNALVGPGGPLVKLTRQLGDPAGPVARLVHAVSNPGGPIAYLQRTIANPGGPIAILGKVAANPGGPIAKLGKTASDPGGPIATVGKGVSTGGTVDSLATALDNADGPMSGLADALNSYVAAHPGKSGGGHAGSGGHKGGGGHPLKGHHAGGGHGHKSGGGHVLHGHHPAGGGGVNPGGPFHGGPPRGGRMSGVPIANTTSITVNYNGRKPSPEDHQAAMIQLAAAIGVS